MLNHVEQEKHKIPRVSFGDACAHPRTVVIVDFDTDATSAAMVRSRRPDNLASRAES